MVIFDVDHPWRILTILTYFVCYVLQYKGAHVKPGFAEHFYSNPGRYKGRENMLVSQNFIAKKKSFKIYFIGHSTDIYAKHS